MMAAGAVEPNCHCGHCGRIESSRESVNAALSQCDASVWTVGCDVLTMRCVMGSERTTQRHFA